MESDSSSFIDTTYSVDLCIDNFIRKNKEERKKNKEDEANKRRKKFEEFMASDPSEIFSSFEGMHFYKFTENKIKFGFNPSEVVHVSGKIKFVCILRYTGSYWRLGRNTIPSNWKLRISDLFYAGEPVGDGQILDVIEEIHSVFMEWSEEYEEFRKRKIQKYWNGEIDFFELDSEDELYLSREECVELRKKRECILKRMIPPASTGPSKKSRIRSKKTDMTPFTPFPGMGIDSD
ncbi:uncharacterized protein LOC123309847 isoform X2 [Coccinella septempunctata]|uniref:uncharacterized protein LOC123309847 isoform X2 n=1 Tax=Coccinella septempunctata TaxID=41139 RepID=UPI001D089F10|nr:uncharacterized protein LOC123309847 isoform X2 [Coccinella septempunctata]